MSRNAKTLKAWTDKNRERIRAQQRAYYHRHKEKLNTPEKKARAKKWREEHKDRMLELQREWYARHRETVAEHRRKKRLTEFGQPQPRKKMTPEEYRQARIRSSQYFQAKRNYFYWTLKNRFSCRECGERDPQCLDFHHRDQNEKEYGIGHKAKCASRARILKELVKCDVLCANCHRRHHFRDRRGLVCQSLPDDVKGAIEREATEMYEAYVRGLENQ